ncbi:biopolymer transport protein ExbB [Sporomusaceae bacterium BoRhaA]|uniref:MotA/TolQ/ExbB proton channel family protein n=1 Tax=Pelorhabdus rhamnosifermentans TaxID=2772457 RepID=UPI001C06408A|nr:MotA/TolQ/ExbB proton channel family protein [Pelorhabdus rhamnosifermentans]MBU2700288.1 biopolymer transport protein ExbB [Pelorhabdus rhamnosifermentans]
MESITQSFAVFQKGGFAMYLILFCSFAVIGIAVERFFYYREMKPKQDGFIDKITPLIEGHDWEAALNACFQTGGVVANVTAKGIRYFEQELAAYETVLEGEVALAVAKLSENLNHLESIVTVAPLLGLLGTVLGMIGSFSVLNIKSGQPLAITGGVGEALVATASGLCVAILSMAVYSYFTHRLDRIITDLEQVCVLLVAQLKQEKNHEHQ